MRFNLKNILATSTKQLLALGTFLVLAFVIQVFVFSISDDEKAHKGYFNTNYKTLDISIPSDLNFAGEKAPTYDFTVQEGFDREIMIHAYSQSQSLLVHKRASRWFPVIEPILKANGVPDDFKYLAVVESNLSNLVSPQQATGYWQLIESTARVYDLEINDEVDERYHIEKSTQAACKYFKEAYSKFKNWTLVAASYNLGMGGIESKLRKQNVKDYYSLLLSEETGRYIYRVLAVKEILSRPKNYGFVLRKKDLYKPLTYKKISVDSSISDLSAFAQKQGLTYKLLKIFNPWLRQSSLSNPDKKKYFLFIPDKNSIDQTFDEEAVGALPEPINDSISTSKAISENEKIHIVKTGETISSISKFYSVDEQHIKMWNLIPENSELKAGQEIVIFKKEI